MSARAESKRRGGGSADVQGLAPMLDPGLYMVATPIGNARDITLRALDILTRADAVAAEDTRQTRKLMEIHGIALAGRPIISYHDRNGPQRRPQILDWLRQGLSVAYCSDAGTPMIADPGFRLVDAALDAEFGVFAVPGASAVLSALSVAGLATDRFLFAGFLPAKRGPRRKALAELAAVPATLVFYESPRRVPAVLAEMAAVLGTARPAAVARELTKKFEEVQRGTLAELAEAASAAGAPRGEVVIVVGPPEGQPEISAGTLDAALGAAMADASVKDAARAVAERLGLPRREVYARALELAGR